VLVARDSQSASIQFKHTKKENCGRFLFSKKKREEEEEEEEEEKRVYAYIQYTHSYLNYKRRAD